MAKDTPHQTHYTRQIHHLLAQVYGRSAVKDSLLDRAVGYFEQEEFTPSEAVSYTHLTLPTTPYV